MARCTLGTMLILAVTFGAAASTFAADPAATQGITWQSELAAAHKIAIAQRKPMLVVFSAEWCGYCRKLERSTLSDPQVVTIINADYVALHVDFDKQRKVAEALEVRSLPCTVLLSPEADLLGRVEGYVEGDQYGETLRTGKRLMNAVDATGSTGER